MPAPAITPENQFVKVRLGNLEGDEYVTIDQMAYLGEMENMLVHFFKKPHGNRETYTVYRGCLIVRCTVNFGNGPERKTTCYLFYKTPAPEGSGRLPTASTSCINPDSPPNSIKGAERLIDKVLDGGVVYYGMPW
jgi:hypothetical protein